MFRAHVSEYVVKGKKCKLGHAKRVTRIGCGYLI